MEQNISVDFESFVISRLEQRISALKKEDAHYHSLCDKALKLLTEIDDTKASDNMHIYDLLQVEFEMQAKEEPQIYLQGFADGIQLMCMLKLI